MGGLILAVLLLFAGAAHAERRVALVIGEDDYKTIRRLDNAVGDAQSIEVTLDALGFEVTLETNRDLRRLRRALDDFREDGKGADVALVFFAGHGAEISGDNRLLPVDADASSLDALKASTLPLEEVREAVAEIAKVGLIILDACRHDPFGTAAGTDGSARGAVAIASAGITEVRPGLGRIGRAEGILFAFSAAPGETAADGVDGHSPFAEALVKYFGTEGLEVRSALTLVQQEVYDLSRGKQLPYVESGLPRLFFAATTRDALPERERLLLAMAEVTPDLRAEVESVAADKHMPLAPLYGALISADLAGESLNVRRKKLAEAADAFVRVREELRTLASGDPDVTRLRHEADEQLSLGAFDAARAKLTEAASIDQRSRHVLKTNFVERTLSEAGTHHLKGSAAWADLQYALAITDYEKAVALYDEVDREDIPDDDRSQQIATWQSLGEVRVTVGNLAAASQAFEARHRISRRRAEANPNNLDWQRDLSVSDISVGDVQRSQGNLPGALRTFEASLDIRIRLAAAEPGNMEWQRDLSVSYNRIGDVRVVQGNLAAALRAYQSGLDIAMRLATADLANTEWQRDLAVSHEKIGDVRRAQGTPTTALKAYQEELRIISRLAAADPGNARWQRDLSLSQIKIGDAQVALGYLTGAMGAYQASLEICTRLAAADPGNTERQRDLSVSHMRIGDVWHQQAIVSEAKGADALEAYQAGVDIIVRLAASDPGNAVWQSDLATGQQKIGRMRRLQGFLPEALEAYQASLDINERLAASDPGNADWQRGLVISHADVALVISHYNVASVSGSAKAHLEAALEIAEQMERNGTLARSDAYFPGRLRDELAKLESVEKIGRKPTSK